MWTELIFAVVVFILGVILATWAIMSIVHPGIAT